MKERDLDEFESIFQRAIIPTIEVDRIAIPDIVVLADASETAAACGRIAQHLRDRFRSRVCVHYLKNPGDLPADDHRVVEGDPLAHLRRITDEEKPSLIIAPAPLHIGDRDDEGLGDLVDALLVATSIPTLLVRGTPDASIFQRILAKIPGGRHDLIEQFSVAFALCGAGGTIRLLHIVNEQDVQRLASALEITPEIETADGVEDLVQAIETRMDHLLRGAIRAAKDAPFHVESDIEVGDPFVIVPQQARDFSLLIVGSQSSHEEFLSSRAYELIRRLPDVTVLAL
jgi:nucleotide-binding universal stress UspA family protein